ncbi:hypothetical protein [uncultured Pseudoteredinibacter sp.]|uniref:hypothetical protein n=1 Tax=uncultured Pseudoteredinibacter sp. TaxID=1641701 RepID=UPI002628B914|nr:hypothetical protein [uncultured Pseudoteredinibacter sp.]
MQEQTELEKAVIADIKAIANTLYSVRSDQGLRLLAEATDKIPLASFDEWESVIRYTYGNTANPTLNLGSFFGGKPPQGQLWLELISWNGRQREKALKRLSSPAPNSLFFILALRRLNDWVPQVRAAARDILPQIAKQSSPEHVTDAIRVTLPNLSSWGRIEKVDKDVLFEIIQTPAISKPLTQQLISLSSGPMSFLMSQVSRTTVLDDQLFEIAQTAIQPSVRARAYRYLFEKRAVWLEARKFEWTDIRYLKGKVKPILGERPIDHEIPFNTLLNHSTNDSSSIVRRVAAEFFIKEMKSLGEEVYSLAHNFANDKSKAVSERGHFALRRLNGEIE